LTNPWSRVWPKTSQIAAAKKMTTPRTAGSEERSIAAGSSFSTDLFFLSDLRFMK
jgi:hypothetical protein